MAGEKLRRVVPFFQDSWVVKHSPMERVKKGKLTILANPKHNSLKKDSSGTNEQEKSV